MKILIVLDDYANKSNGLSLSTQRFVKQFKEKGHDVRILSYESVEEEIDYGMPILKIPFFNKLIEKQGYRFSKPIKNKIIEAVKWAEIVHIEDPFFLSYTTAKIAKRHNKIITGTFHIYPENLTNSVQFLNNKIINKLFLEFFKNGTYKYCKFIQCPTKKVENYLRKHNFKGKLKAISNGIPKDFIIEELPPVNKDGFNILSVGRYSNEKSQITLIEAINRSKYKKDIKLYLLGKGPLENKYRELLDKYSINYEMRFVNQEELREIMKKSNIYVHCSTIEIEGMSCMEAFSQGVVPIIADSTLSSTIEYALTPENKFIGQDYKDLSKKIDYFIENPSKIEELRLEYLKLSKELLIDKCAEKVLDIMKQIVENVKEG